MGEVRNAEREWDAVVIGTGMGGATLGYALARAGWRVLFCEKGRFAPGNPAVLRGAYAETRFSSSGASEAEVLRAAGRYPEAISDLSTGKTRSFVPFIGCGGGGSTALYGMVLERFFPADFEPEANYPPSTESTLPERWPVSYGDLLPYYEMAERLYGVRGEGDPLRVGERLERVGCAPPLSPAARDIAASLTAQGFHPYRLPLACDYVSGCQGCQGYLCPRECKHDSARSCLAPALEHFGASLLDECEVVRLEATHDHVTGVVCRRGDEEFRVSGRVIVLAAGALATPFLLLGSRSAQWPDGLANSSGLVGRTLMRHYVDLYAIFPKSGQGTVGNTKELGCNDLYLSEAGKFGSIQSFGAMPPASLIVDDIQRELRHGVHPLAAAAFGLVKPIARPVLDRIFARATVVATVMEDLPYADNRVLPPQGAGPGSLAITYRIRPAEAARIAQFRRRMKTALSPYWYLLLKQAENNQRIAHACGTCRFGDDERTSVLDAHNRAHGLTNLYVVDASFFPSSGGTNPALTIAANALRVAAHLIGQDKLEARA